MLREIKNVQQIAGEKPRRWFFSHEADLLVWFGEDGMPFAFQLAYGKYREEHAIRWKTGVGFEHYKVDTGVYGRELPLLVADGIFPAGKVIEQFQKLAAEVPSNIVDFICARLREHPEFGDDS
ncbi:MAG TPA: hypothetical protein VFB01_13265 [Burkholderiales bacterium]|nr:hypothetical protein [Burkholderiales bacterium]